MFCFNAYGQILKIFQAYIYKQTKMHLSHVLKCKNGYHNQFIIFVRVWSKYQKLFTNHFVHFIFKVLGFNCKL